MTADDARDDAAAAEAAAAAAPAEPAPAAEDPAAPEHEPESTPAAESAPESAPAADDAAAAEPADASPAAGDGGDAADAAGAAEVAEEGAGAGEEAAAAGAGEAEQVAEEEDALASAGDGVTEAEGEAASVQEPGQEQELRFLKPYDEVLMKFVVHGYVGDVVDHVYHGRGTAIFVDGNEYEGEWEQGEMHGIGRFTFGDRVVYHGEFVHNMPTGEGTITWPDGSEYHGTVLNGLRHGTGRFKCADSETVYEGQWEHGKRTGQGTMYHNAEQTHYYRGMWLDNFRHGHGVLQYASGNSYTGEWRNGQKHGMGCMKWVVERQLYDGMWQDGVPHGHGEYIWMSDEAKLAQFNRYTGEWVDGKRNGQGIYFYASGAVYDGEWSENLKHGQGKFTFEDGAVFDGQFANDKMVGFDKQAAGIDQGVPIDIQDLCARSADPGAMLGAVRNVVLRYVSDFKEWYNHYCGLGRGEAYVFSMTRLEFWKFLQDCNIPTDTLTLAQIDRTIARAAEAKFGAEADFFQRPHNARHPLLFRELVSWLIRVADIKFPAVPALADRLTQLVTHFVQPAMVDFLEIDQAGVMGEDNVFSPEIRAYLVENRAKLEDLFASRARHHAGALAESRGDLTVTRRDFLFMLKDQGVFDDAFTPKHAMDVLAPTRNRTDSSFVAAEIVYLEFLQGLVGLALARIPGDAPSVQRLTQFVDKYVFPKEADDDAPGDADNGEHKAPSEDADADADAAATATADADADADAEKVSAGDILAEAEGEQEPIEEEAEQQEQQAERGEADEER